MCSLLAMLDGPKISSPASSATASARPLALGQPWSRRWTQQEQCSTVTDGHLCQLLACCNRRDGSVDPCRSMSSELPGSPLLSNDLVALASETYGVMLSTLRPPRYAAMLAWYTPAMRALRPTITSVRV